jgi:large subunit ribosomal protein L21
MYAIVRTGGKQYKVAAGDVIRVEKLDSKLGAQVELETLMVGGDKAQFGKAVTGSKVLAVVTQHNKDKKILVFHKKRRKGYQKTKGHRQPYTDLFILSIAGADGKSVKADKQPHIFDAEKSLEIKMKKAAARAEAKAAGNDENAETKVAAPKKKVAKKVTKKKAAKKTTAKKKSTKK